MRRLTLAEMAEILHAEHHDGTVVPSLDACEFHTRAEYEYLAALVMEEPSWRSRWRRRD